MVFETVKVVNKEGIHMRPASELAQKAMTFKCKITIENGAKVLDGKSVMFLMTSGIKCGEDVIVRCDGEDEEEALKTLVDFIASGMGD